MANSSIGPGFLTQTTVFTQQLMASFGFVILVSILLDIGAQLNTWRILTVSELRAQDLSNQLLPGLGYFIAALVIHPLGYCDVIVGELVPLPVIRAVAILMFDPT